MRISDWSSDVCSSDLTLKAYQAVDFDDLIKLPVELFGNHPEALEKWQRKLKYLLIDEYQDTHRSEEHTSELQSLMRISYAVFCLTKKTHTTIEYKPKSTHHNLIRSSTPHSS